MNEQTRENVTPDGERLAKRMADAGLCSRREAERWIEEGRVKVNGKTITTPAFTVTGEDEVVVNGKLLEAKDKTRLWLYYKPTGLVTTHSDPQGRPTVFASLPKTLPRVISVGRLDINSEGLLLLTNSGALARKLELPENGWIRRYRVRVYGLITATLIEEMKKGVVSKGVHYGSIDVKIDTQGAGNSWLTVSLKEGKNREIRKVFEHFGCKVNRLIRTSYGPFQLGSMKHADIKEVSHKVLSSFVKLDT